MKKTQTSTLKGNKLKDSCQMRISKGETRRSCESSYVQASFCHLSLSNASRFPPTEKLIQPRGLFAVFLIKSVNKTVFFPIFAL